MEAAGLAGGVGWRRRLERRQAGRQAGRRRPSRSTETL